MEDVLTYINRRYIPRPKQFGDSDDDFRFFVKKLGVHRPPDAKILMYNTKANIYIKYGIYYPMIRGCNHHCERCVKKPCRDIDYYNKINDPFWSGRLLK